MDDIGLIILSVFCAGGLYAYVREAVRLARLVSSGTQAGATVLKKEKLEGGGDSSVAHYLVTYEFTDDCGQRHTHERNLNSLKFFDTLSEGGTLEILYMRGTYNSYPMAQVRADLRLSRLMILAISVFWAAMSAFLIYRHGI